ncbi:hypothetical protein L2E82_05726 [Cichorium intybus]|uniref:Uncharacterized protein n=1 Tax=Cichorium intybus TaxID=13427 RepID=A0ACB9HA95_CICIN|nr:hypothetical protein L2E82_05726 [Cichorium intybus]
MMGVSWLHLHQWWFQTFRFADESLRSLQMLEETFVSPLKSSIYRFTSNSNPSPAFFSPGTQVQFLSNPAKILCSLQLKIYIDPAFHPAIYLLH